MTQFSLTLQHRFLWSGGPEQNKITWVKWEPVCLPKEKGGLGLKDIRTFNLALLAKWKWILFQHHGQLWARVLESKYGGWRSLDTTSRATNDSIWWRDLKMALLHSQEGQNLQNRTLWRVGCGDRIKFWEDRWVSGEETLSAKYPRLYLISCQQNQFIRQMGDHKGTEWEWEFTWRRPLFDNEISTAVSFLREVEGKTIQQHRSDEWVWKADPSDIYSVQSAYNMLRGEIAEGSQNECFKELWKIKEHRTWTP